MHGATFFFPYPNLKLADHTLSSRRDQLLTPTPSGWAQDWRPSRSRCLKGPQFKLGHPPVGQA